ncbi:MAG TPA: GntR family transcriptional regulator [Gaiellaceae bacterium]|nr:GntR family transcriptional regulator [Gaiellaceae bacterium]
MDRVLEPLTLSRSAGTAAAEQIREAIVDGRLQPGERLKEEQLARELGISRTPVREALVMLQTEGLVDATPNRGSTVRTYSREELEEMYELRALLEGHAAGRAAERITAAQLETLRASCDRFRRLVGGSDVRALVAENSVFHQAILEAAGSERLATMLREVVVLPLVYRSYVWYSPEQAAASCDYHHRLVETFAAGDARAAADTMHRHVMEARDVLVAHFSEDDG